MIDSTLPPRIPSVMIRNRRRFLKGIATTLALPAMESIAVGAGVSGEAGPPLRIGFIYVPNGVNGEHWFPEGTGADYKLSDSLRSLEPHRNEISVIRNLAHRNAFANGDGAGDHARANATFLTGCQARKTAGADIRNGISVDQLAAAQAGYHTRIPSLELSTDPPRRSGHCDSGYSCAYQFNLSWLDENTPAPAERDPRLVFEKLFGSGNPQEDARRRAYRKSILDFVRNDARRLHTRLGTSDRAKLEEYTTAVRDIERRIELAENFPVDVPHERRPGGIPDSYREHIRIQFDLMALAFETDTTRVATFMLAHDGSNRPFPEIGVASGHHQLSHHRGDPAALEQIASIDRFYAECFSDFLTKLKNTREGDGNLLDHSMLVYGSGISDGDRHNHDNLPIILAGRGNGNLHPGRVIEAAPQTPMTNLYLTLLEAMGVRASRFGDSTGTLSGI